MAQESYSSKKNREKHLQKEERSDLERYIRDSLWYQQYTFYLLLLLTIIAIGLFVSHIFP